MFSTAGFFKAKFWLEKLDFYIDDDVLDAMSNTGDRNEKKRILDKYIKISEKVADSKWQTS